LAESDSFRRPSRRRSTGAHLDSLRVPSCPSWLTGFEMLESPTRNA
jgi:hypothetical protein